MERRRYLSLLAAGTVGTGGCLDALEPGPERAPTTPGEGSSASAW